MAEMQAAPRGAAAFQGDDPPCFAVSLVKLTVMSLCTLGIYELFWFYKNWELIKRRDGTDIRPFWRAFFAVFFCYACFARLRQQAEAVHLGQSIAAGPLAAGWIITSLLWKLPDPYWLVSLFSFIFMLPVQALANQVNATSAPAHDPNDHFSALNWVGVVVGGVAVVLVFVGAFVPD